MRKKSRQEVLEFLTLGRIENKKNKEKKLILGLLIGAMCFLGATAFAYQA